MNNWPTVKLSSLAQFKNGLNYSKENWGKGLKVIGVSDFKDRLYPQYEELEEINPNGVVREEDYLEEGDILFVRSNGNRMLIGRSLFIKGLKEKMSHSGFTIRLRFISSSVHIPFFVYLVRTSIIRAALSASGGGTNINNLNQQILGNLKVPLPPLQIQKKIAAILSTYDDLIENNKRRIALLEKMAEEIYREWFVRMRFPGHEKAKFEKGVPKGWEKKRLGEFCMLQRGFDLPDSQVVAGEYPVIASTSIKTYHNQYKVKPPVITTGRSGSLGKVLFTNSKAWPLNTTLFVKSFFGNSPYLIYYILKNMGLENFNAGAGVPSLNRNHINGISLAVPSETLQKAFDHKIDGMFKQSELLVMANDKLSRSRDMLLSRLISGKLPVENLDIQFPPGMMDETEGEATTAPAKEDTDAKPHHGRRHRAGNTKEAKA